MNGINIAALLAATLALIIAFAWNDAATKSLQHVLPVRHHNDIVKITVIYAIFVTIFIIFLLFLLNQTNKMYYTYTGKLLINFVNFNNGFIRKSSILPLWTPDGDQTDHAQGDDDQNGDTQGDDDQN